MNPHQLKLSGQNIQGKVSINGRWLGAALGLIAAAAIALTFYLASTMNPATVKAPARLVGQQVPDANTQGITGYIAAHRVAPAVDTAPDVARRAARDAARAAQVPNAASLGVTGYLNAHEAAALADRRAAQIARLDALARLKDESQALPAGQQVPDAAQQGVNAYLRAHDDPSFHAPRTQYVPDSDRHMAADFQAAQAALTKPDDRSFHTPPTSNYFYNAPAGQQVPDAATLGVAGYVKAHTAAGPDSRATRMDQLDALAQAKDQSQTLPAGQLVPDAATQGVMSYLNAHAAAGPDSRAAQIERRGILAQLNSESQADRSFHTPATSDYPAGQQVPDAATQGVEHYLSAHGVNVPGLWDHPWLRANR